MRIAGVTQKELAMMRAWQALYGPTDPRDVRPESIRSFASSWIACRFTPLQARAWWTQGIHDPRVALRYRARGIGPAEAGTLEAASRRQPPEP